MSSATGSPGARGRRAIVLIPGIRQEERFRRRDVLVSNLAAVETWPLARGERIKVAGETAQRLTARPVRGEGQPSGPDLDVFEAYWADMVPAEAEAGPWQKLGHGLDLLAYWLFSWRTWRALAVSRYITVGLMFGGLIMVLWYVALVLLVVDTLRTDETTAALGAIPVVGVLLDGLFWAADRIAHWYWWALIAFVLSFVRVDALVQLARFVKDYFENRPDEFEVGLRDRLRQRIGTTLGNVLAEPYEEVFIVAHSFATTPVLDLLADWPHRGDFRRLRLVTLGSPIAVLSYRSKWLQAELEQILNLPELEVWFDFHAPTDWLCTAIPGHEERYAQMSRELEFEAPLRQRLTGQTHMLYYRHPAVLELLAAPCPVPGARASAAERQAA